MVSTIKMQHEIWMRKALELASRGIGKTSPNPVVGAVVVSPKGELIGEGWHQRAGMPHAEVNAIEDTKIRGNITNKATLYVTLEPCSTSGRTGPCTQAIIDAGIQRVICAAEDPNPAHSGKGLNILRDAGIEVIIGVLEKESMEMNRAFNHWIVTKTPLVTLKSAMSLDGRVATAAGESKWITGPEARAHAMQFRAQVDAIITGVGTVIADNCSLTVRSGSGFNIISKSVSSKLRRIILDSQARIPLDSNVISDPWASLTTIVVLENTSSRRIKALEEKVNVWKISADKDGHPNLSIVLERLGAENVTHLLVEAGGTLSESFFRHQKVHRIHFYYAPKIIGGKDSMSGIEGRGIRSLSEAILISNPSCKKLGDDFLLTADIVYPRIS